MEKQNTKRFSNRVEDYVKYRPGYPKEIVSYLQQEWGLTTNKLIADIGAGTGISTALFLEAGYAATAIEPNKEMREKSTVLLGIHPGFNAIDGSAEDTQLADNSVDAVIAGQAFHWFDVPKTKVEFQRILKKDGLIILMWNERLIESAFEVDYNKLILVYASDYVEKDHRKVDQAQITAFYEPASYKLKIFHNEQEFDFEGLKGRLLSSSYMPTRDDARFAQMVKDLELLFDRYQKNDRITIKYSTKVYTGAVKP